MQRVVVAKGKKVATFDLRKAPPSDAELAAVIMGPTGNLRAPALKVGHDARRGIQRRGVRRPADLNLGGGD